MRALVDFHTHILPRMDDGSDSVETSLKMLSLEKEQSIDTVVMTPHFYPDNERPEQFLERRQRAREMLEQALTAPSHFPNILIGAEVRYFEGISDCEYLSDLRIEESDCILVEMPMTKWSQRMLTELSEIGQKQGLTPIIAHIDRYIGGFRPCVYPEQLAEIPVLVQASAEFFIRRPTRKLALKMLRMGDIHLLGSDCHNMNMRRPNLDGAVAVIKRALGNEAIEYINSFENKVIHKDENL